MSQWQPSGPVVLALLLTMAAGLNDDELQAENWPRWRGPHGNAVSMGGKLPVTWNATSNIRWKADIAGEGSSSPIVWNNRIFLTSSNDNGAVRTLHCINRATGKQLWSAAINDENPEVTSALTGHAAATPVCNENHVVAFFGNAGVVCYDHSGKQVWRRRFGEFESELGLASSPIIYRDSVILVCDHDGNSFRSFDSFLVALDLKTGDVRWRTDRPRLERSWSTPILVPVGDQKRELVVAAQDELRGYDPENGQQQWHVAGLTGWVAPSPVYGNGFVFAASGRDGPIMAVRPGGRGDVTKSHIVWQHARGGAYICSPLLYQGRLYVNDEQGILRCFASETGKLLYRKRLAGRFVASAMAGDDKVYLTTDTGTAYVIAAGDKYRLLAENRLGEECLASPGISDNELFIRTERHLFCIGATADR